MTTEIRRRRRGYSEGSIYQRKDGRWTASISLGYRNDGRRKRRDVYGKTKADVAAELRKLQSAADAGALAQSGTMTVGQFVDHWLENIARPKVRVTTYETYRGTAEHVKEHLGGTALSKLRAGHVEQFYATLEREGMSGRSRQACAQ